MGGVRSRSNHAPWILCSAVRTISKLLHIPSGLAGLGSVEVKFGKNRTDADVRLYTSERDRLEREREEVKTTLATLRKDRREVKEELSSCQGTATPPIGHVWTGKFRP